MMTSPSFPCGKIHIRDLCSSMTKMDEEEVLGLTPSPAPSGSTTLEHFSGGGVVETEDRNQLVFGINDENYFPAVEESIWEETSVGDIYNADGMESEANDEMSRPKTAVNGMMPHSVIDVRNLVDFLSGCPSFSSSLRTLQIHFQGKLCDKVITKYPNIFAWKEDTVTLQPLLKICEKHNGFHGCENQDKCNELHICKQYVMDKCQETNCVFSHKWDVGGNFGILERLYIDHLPFTTLLKLARAYETMPVPSLLEVCQSYNGNGCFTVPCPSLHICKTFFLALAGNVASECSDTCTLNHDILDPSCSTILSLNKVPTNETPRDISIFLISTYPSLLPQGMRAVTRKSLFSQSEVESKRNTKTVWSHYLHGDVDTCEICYKSVEDICPFEKTGCKRLHSTNHFHWQFSADGSHWFNLRADQVKCLERAYCDPSKDSIKLPRLDPATLERSLKTLFTIMGRASWSCDFPAMTLTNSSGTQTLQLRRLCTETVPGVILKPSTYVWYCCDKNKRWVLYDNTDTLGYNNLAFNISSEVIENHYISDQVTSLSLSNFHFDYILDFNSMSQINQTTGTRQKMKRRPEPHLEEEEMEGLPESWKLVYTIQHAHRIVLDRASPEFNKIMNLFHQNKVLQIKWLRIERIQNPYLWSAYQNKVREMTVIYGSTEAVNIQYLFHGTDPLSVNKICEENFDWRLNGSKNGRAFGCGTYFSTNPLSSLQYSQPDQVGHRYLFVSRVAVGTKIIGDQYMVKPPINPMTQLPYDSSVNSDCSPTIIVKYDKQHYYPEYLIILA
ncbi:protein mono-ADP-ribosyltransferase PARP12-like isoform X2 [Macrobrachium nipponense]|uniref:protein mono-ADP-ribosyltransferase PARP12-like isoform X2 n=1 Tax=Macrobrachium nipponense TaxID=159736 RepID=UPI0030C85EE9